jgi:hypothetical protein
MNPNQQNQELQVKASDEVLKGLYANMVQVAHTPEEFILDFMNLFPPAGQLTSRVIISPQHAKRFLAALQDNVARYEKQFGNIAAGSGPTNQIGFKTE